VNNEPWTMQDVWTSGEWPTELAIHRIVTAPDFHHAAGIRNQIGMAAMHRKRPQADADACYQAFDDRWGHMLTNQRLGPIGPLHYTGD
jgi:hypothetical protein